MINSETNTTGDNYDDDNRVTKVTTDGASRSYSYDGLSRIQNRVTSHGTSPVLTESLNYRTVNGAATGQIASFHSDSVGNHDVTYAYTYDGNGNILSISDGSSTTSYVYDSANQLIRENNQAAGKTWVWDYDDAGNILSRTEYAYTTGTLGTPTATVSYGYGDTNWGDLLTSYNGQAITYDTIGNPTSDGVWNYTWEHGRQLAQMTNTDDPNTEVTVTYTYDANGLRTGMTVTTRTYHSHSYTSVVTAPTCTTRGYTTYTCACGDSYTDSQTAATGHRNTSTVITEPTCTQRGVIRHTCTVCGNVSATYSPALGHVPGTGINLRTCTRCGETIGSGGGEITPVDPPITPIDPTVPIQSTETGTMEPQSTDNGDDRILVSEQTVEYEYFYTGDKLTYMTQTTQANQGTAVTEDIWFYYDAAGTPYALKYQGEYFYYATNAQGDVTGILNSSGNEIAAYTYDAWGNPLAASGTHALANLNPLRYRGYVYDQETELYYLQSRYYNPEVGRFLNADGYWATGQGILGNNMFAYCNNNPVNCCDPEGCSPGAVALGFLIFAVCVTMSGCVPTGPSDGPYPGRANCYAYAMKQELNPRTGKPFRYKPAPGEFSGTAPFDDFDKAGNDLNRVRNKLISKVLKDMDYLNYTFEEVDNGNHVTKHGNWLVALSWSTSIGQFHWYRREDDGRWSHKPGDDPITFTDFSDQPITDPQYGDIGYYDQFWGYFEVGPNRGG